MLYILGEEVRGATDVINDDAAVLHLQYATQWDGLGHVGEMFDADDDGVPEPTFYNGFRGGQDLCGPTELSEAGATSTVDALTTTSVHALGVENMALNCVQGRA